MRPYCHNGRWLTQIRRECVWSRLDVFGATLMCFELIALRSSWVIDCVHVLSHLSFVECHCVQTCPTAWLPQCLQLFSAAWAPQPGRCFAPGHWLCLLPVELLLVPFVCACAGTDLLLVLGCLPCTAWSRSWYRCLAACLVPSGVASGTWLIALCRLEPWRALPRATF